MNNSGWTAKRAANIYFINNEAAIPLPPQPTEQQQQQTFDTNSINADPITTTDLINILRRTVVDENGSRVDLQKLLKIVKDSYCCSSLNIADNVENAASENEESGTYEDQNGTTLTESSQTTLPAPLTESASMHQLFPVISHGVYVGNNWWKKDKNCLNVLHKGKVYRIHDRREKAKANEESVFRCAKKECNGRITLIGYQIGMVEAGDKAMVVKEKGHSCDIN
uniref:Uncharacterized protein n=1 Tax=Panagrolaimus sp. ES5 TaxID=591445 RepID=A0AC34GF05_9BILA